MVKAKVWYRKRRNASCAAAVWQGGGKGGSFFVLLLLRPGVIMCVMCVITAHLTVAPT
jgi:hypothetical protein